MVVWVREGGWMKWMGAGVEDGWMEGWVGGGWVMGVWVDGCGGTSR